MTETGTERGPVTLEHLSTIRAARALLMLSQASILEMRSWSGETQEESFMRNTILEAERLSPGFSARLRAAAVATK